MRFLSLMLMVRYNVRTGLSLKMGLWSLWTISLVIISSNISGRSGNIWIYGAEWDMEMFRDFSGMLMHYP